MLLNNMKFLEALTQIGIPLVVILFFFCLGYIVKTLVEQFFKESLEDKKATLNKSLQKQQRLLDLRLHKSLKNHQKQLDDKKAELDKKLKEDLQEHQLEMNKQLQNHQKQLDDKKAELDKELKKELQEYQKLMDTELKNHQKQLDKEITEHRTMFTLLHTDRMECIKQLYQNLVEFHEAGLDYTKATNLVKINIEKDEKYRENEVSDAWQKFDKHYQKNKIFIPKDIVLKIDNTFGEYYKKIRLFSVNRQSLNSELDRDNYKRFMLENIEISQTIREQNSSIIEEIEDSFRKLMGEKV